MASWNAACARRGVPGDEHELQRDRAEEDDVERTGARGRAAVRTIRAKSQSPAAKSSQRSAGSRGQRRLGTARTRTLVDRRPRMASEHRAARPRDEAERGQDVELHLVAERPDHAAAVSGVTPNVVSAGSTSARFVEPVPADPRLVVEGAVDPGDARNSHGEAERPRRGPSRPRASGTMRRKRRRANSARDGRSVGRRGGRGGDAVAADHEEDLHAEEAPLLERATAAREGAPMRVVERPPDRVEAEHHQAGDAAARVEELESRGAARTARAGARAGGVGATGARGPRVQTTALDSVTPLAEGRTACARLSARRGGGPSPLRNRGRSSPPIPESSPPGRNASPAQSPGPYSSLPPRESVPRDDSRLVPDEARPRLPRPLDRDGGGRASLRVGEGAGRAARRAPVAPRSRHGRDRAGDRRRAHAALARRSREQVLVDPAYARARGSSVRG